MNKNSPIIREFKLLQGKHKGKGENMRGYDITELSSKTQQLIKENNLAHSETTTKNCRENCAACGAACFGEGVCFEKR